MKAPKAAADLVDHVSSEARSVERARAGDADAFGLLVIAHTSRAFALARRIVRADADAEEVVQDAFLRAWHALPGFRGEAAFGTWLHRIVVRRALDRRAQMQVRGRRETPLDAALVAPGPAGEDAAGDRVRIERLMAVLPDLQRAAVTLYYLHDRSVSDVAQALGLNENTVKTHLHRARATLRRAWQAEDGA